MSKPEKYPGLYAGAKAARMNYVTAYQRVKGGMTVEQALSTPVKIRRGGGGRKAHTLQERLAAAQHRAAVRRKRYSKRLVPDSAPPRIRALRAEYCMKFMRGEADQKVLAKLQEYANECRTAKEHPARIPDEYAPRRYGREAVHGGNDKIGRASCRERV